MSSDSGFHFDAIAVLRRHESGTNKQENNVRFCEILTNDIVPGGSRNDTSIVPDLNEVFTFQNRKMLNELITEASVVMGVCYEQSGTGNSLTHLTDRKWLALCHARILAERRSCCVS